jgi:Uma2 family endonuclease
MAHQSRRAIIAPSEIEYPDSDGKPIAETGIHVEVILMTLASLRRHFAADPNVAVLANMFLYYVEGDPKQCVCPDLYVIRDVPKNTHRHTYKVWEEGKGPDLVIEATSKQTRDEDLRVKFRLYRDVLRVREYFLFDPAEEYLEPSLQGYRLAGRRYVPIKPVAGRLPSKVLGLHLERDDLDLRLCNPRAGGWIPTQEELAKQLEQSQAARRRAEAARRQAENAQFAAEAEVERLRREIESLRKKRSKGS